MADTEHPAPSGDLSRAQDENTEEETNAEGDGSSPPAAETDANVQLALDSSEVGKEDSNSRSSAKSTRIPKLSSRAAFTRTPSSQMNRPDDGLPTVGPDGVLITELQASDSEEGEDEKDEENDEGGDDKVDDSDREDGEMKEDEEEHGLPEHVVEQVTVETVQVRVTDEDYDTDLDVEEEEGDDPKVSYYKSVCDQLGLVPVAYFLRHMSDPNIRMRYRGLGSDATRAIALALKDNISLERLDLSGNWIGPEGARYMARLLEENDYITEVTLQDNKIGSEGGQLMASMMNLNGGLRKLDLSGNELDDKCVEVLASAIENNKYLRELNLSHNKLTEMGADLLGHAIGANENLDVLDLSWNHLRERGAIAVAKGLKENVRLKNCNLSWNGMDARGGLAIADAMLVNQSLLELDISGNRLTQEVATKMAKVLTTNDTIKILRMGNNLITSAGAIALASAINNTEHCELEELDLSDVPVEYEFLRTMEDIRTNRPNFKVKYGPVMRAGNTLDDINKPAIDVDRIKKEPVVILKEHIVVNDMRLLDILKRYDEDNSLSITAEDFVTALEELAVPYDRKRLEESVQKFATTATGKIYFGSFISDEYNKTKPVEAT